MNDEITSAGSIERTGDAFAIRLERIIEHEPGAVWRMLTASDALPQWLAPGSVEAQTGGAIRVDFPESGASIDATVRACEPPRLLEYSWSSGDEPQRPLRWELEPIAAGTHLVLGLRLPADEDAVKSAAGWDAHLEMLLAALEGVPIRFPVDHFLALRRRYAEQLAARSPPQTQATG